MFTKINRAQTNEIKGAAMTIDGRIDDLIEAGWGVLDSDFDPVAFQRWRRKAFDCLTAVVGPDHVYTRHFANSVQQDGKTDLLAAAGILSAAQQVFAGSGRSAARGAGSMQSTSTLTEKTGGAQESREGDDRGWQGTDTQSQGTRR